MNREIQKGKREGLGKENCVAGVEWSSKEKNEVFHDSNRCGYQQVSEIRKSLPPKNKENAGQRPGAHRRQRSICISPERNVLSVLSSSRNRNTSVHFRNLSDADSVVYFAPGECSEINDSFRTEGTDKNSLGSNIETANGSLVSVEKKKTVRNSDGLTVLGLTGTTSYCRYCKMEVHTVVEVNSCYQNKLLSAANQILACCRLPGWIAELIVHKCPKCSLVLGRSR